MLAVFTVDNLADAGLGSLRQAIDDANANIGADTVEFQAGLSGTIALISGEMLITDELTIDGPGAAQLTIDAQQNSRIFHVTAASGPVTFEGLHLTGGNALGNGGAIFSETNALLSIEGSTISGNVVAGGGGFPDARGGGLYSFGDVTVTDSTISGNSATGASSGHGGGIFANGDVTVTDSTISGNSATADSFGVTGGGGIATRGDVTITGSTISVNLATGGGGFHRARGGGVYADGDVTIIDSTISGNSATSDSFGSFGTGGGAIFANRVTITSSTISGNSATGFQAGGGGILARDDVAVTDSTISDNSAFGNLEVHGGGIFALGDVTVTSSTVSGNLVTGFGSSGGGIRAGSDVTITNSTISGNRVFGVFTRGGGIIASADVTVTGSTISDNFVSGGVFGPFAGAGGGIWVDDTPVTIENSIVAGNRTGDLTAPDLRPGTGPLTVRYSLIGDNTDSGLAEAPVGMPDANGNLIGTAASPIDPMLGPLQDNGGPTFTHALLAGSPAINAGDPLFVPPPNFDQRGDPFVRVFGGRIDMGAFELQPATLDEKLQQLLDTGVLNRGQANSLLVKLNSAGNERARLNRLSAFIDEVNALVRAGILSAAEGQCLIDTAESLRMSLSVDAVLASAVSSARGSKG